MLIGITSTVFIVSETKKVIEMFVCYAKKRNSPGFRKFKKGKESKLDI